MNYRRGFHLKMIGNKSIFGLINAGPDNLFFKNYIFTPIIILGLILNLSFIKISANAAAQQADSAFIRKVRVMQSDRTGVSSPAGLAFSSRANSFQATETGMGASSTLTRITPFGHRAGSVGIAASLQDPINLAYDSTLQRLLLLQSRSQLFELKEDSE